jgi:hypothetical protein
LSGRGLGVQEAAEALAETAKIARPQPHAVRIRVGNGAVRGRTGEGFVSQLGSCFLEQLRSINSRQRRRREIVAARSFERVAARLDLAAQIARGAGGAADFLKVIEVRL